MQPLDLFNAGIPESIGPFRVVRQLGEGGMGAVYLAERMEQFSQQVAIKILHPALFPESAEAAVAREGRVLAALDHAGIVRVLDMGVHVEVDNSGVGGGLRYLVMEYVDGLRLDTYCDLQRIAIRDRVGLLLQILDAVEHAHRHLVIHADLKPENILVTAEGKVRLLDFGVATILSELGAQESGAGSYSVMYASPEQRAGERLTVASDIYSLGLIAQTILTGLEPRELAVDTLAAGASSGIMERPEAGWNSARRWKALDATLMEEIASCRGTTPDGLISVIKGDLEAILAKALALDPAKRFQSAQEMADEFNRHLLGYPIQTRPAGWVTRNWKWALRNKLAACFAVGFLLVLTLSVFGVVARAADAARKRQMAITRLHDLVRLTDALAGELFDSLHGLQGSEAAQAALLASAHQTMDKLAAEEDQDARLRVELAQEYEKLARLELGRNTPDGARQFREDVQKESQLLSQSDPNDPEVGAMLNRLPGLKDSQPLRK